MRHKVILAAVVAVAASMTFTTGASGATSGELALWSATTKGSATTAVDCDEGNGRAVDENQFCVIDDAGSVELGVKFTTAQPVLITGVRVYRVDQGTVTGSLWSVDGTLLATGAFDPPAGNGWQDLRFTRPVLIEAGQTYVASYSAPNADYAFEWSYFTNRSTTVGPITALESAESGGNGVYSYCDVSQVCDPFPTLSFNDTNYWVSPLWTTYLFSGFAQPVDADKLNTAKAGSAIPVKFSLGGDKGLSIFKEGYPKATKAPCDAGAAVDAIENTVVTGSSTLTYDALSGQYSYLWKTNRAWAGSCVLFELGLNDDSPHAFGVRLTK